MRFYWNSYMMVWVLNGGCRTVQQPGRERGTESTTDCLVVIPEHSSPPPTSYLHGARTTVNAEALPD